MHALHGCQLQGLGVERTTAQRALGLPCVERKQAHCDTHEPVHDRTHQRCAAAADNADKVRVIATTVFHRMAELPGLAERAGRFTISVGRLYVKEGELVVVAANFLIDAESNLKAAVGGFGHSDHGTAAPATKGSSNQAVGTVEDVDAKAGTINLNHGPVASLKWPAMTMEFKLANESLLQTLKPGAKVTVEFVERQPGEWVITSAKPTNSADPHAGH